MDQWNDAPNMQFERKNHASCTLGKYLYVFFGQPDIHAVERLAVEYPNAEWETIRVFKA